ncbi:unnamed protein product [Paramecium primaurelia]|uniref:Uncharacterized protein n=1 Tax=Paramecium primaurelia TaxID=5886 RepID=A0A8S1JYD9_PARPR|nr:unnamed protein product [Paramecium primaurelia]
MYRSLGLLIRSTSIYNQMWIRGPKKAKVEAVATSDDLINIWKDRKDPEIKEIDEYPLWLLELAVPLDSIDVASIQIAANDKAYHPPASHVRSIVRSIKRQRIILMNKYTALNRDGDVIGDDDLNDQEDQLEHIQQEKLAEEAAAEEAARLKELEEDDEDTPKARKPAIRKEEDDDDKPAAGKAGDKDKAASGAKGGAAATGAGGKAGDTAKGGKKK